jgi:hypothetical protein
MAVDHWIAKTIIQPTTIGLVASRLLHVQIKKGAVCLPYAADSLDMLFQPVLIFSA